MADVQMLGPSSSLRPRYQWLRRLEGRPYRFRMNYLARARVWTLDIYDGAGNALSLGRTVTVRSNLLRGLTAAGFPRGEIFVAAPEGYGDPTRHSFRSSHRMFYRPEADVLALELAGTPEADKYRGA